MFLSGVCFLSRVAEIARQSPSAAFAQRSYLSIHGVARLSCGVIPCITYLATPSVPSESRAPSRRFPACRLSVSHRSSGTGAGNPLPSSRLARTCSDAKFHIIRALLHAQYTNLAKCMQAIPLVYTPFNMRQRSASRTSCTTSFLNLNVRGSELYCCCRNSTDWPCPTETSQQHGWISTHRQVLPLHPI